MWLLLVTKLISPVTWSPELVRLTFPLIPPSLGCVGEAAQPTARSPGARPLEVGDNPKGGHF